MNLICALSNEIPNQPVVSPVSGNVFERRLIIKYLEDNNNRDPINGNKLRKDQLINLDLNIIEQDQIINYRKEKEIDHSIPELIKYLKDLWNALFVEKQNLQEQWNVLLTEKRNLQIQLDTFKRQCKCEETLKENEILKSELLKQRERKCSINDQIYTNGLKDNIYSNLPSLDSINKENHFDMIASSINSSNGLSSLSDQTKYHLANNHFKNSSLVHSTTNYSSTNSKFSDHQLINVFGGHNSIDLTGCKFNTYKQSRFDDRASPKFTDLTDSSNRIDQSNSFQKYNNKQLSYSSEYVNVNNDLGRTHRTQSVIIQNDSPFEIELNGLKNCDNHLRIDYFNQPNMNYNRKYYKPLSEQINSSSSGSLRGSYIKSINNLSQSNELYCNLIDMKVSKKQNLANYQNILMYNEDHRHSKQSINELESTRLENLNRNQMLTNKNEKDRNESDIKMSRAETWSKDFDNLLNDKFGIKIFENFLRDEHSDENISFWRKCEDYREKFENLSNHKDVQKKEAKKIYTDFFKSDRINIEKSVKDIIRSNLDNPTKELFAEAQKKIYILMRDDSYRRFLASDKYKKALIDCKNNLLPIELINTIDNSRQFEFNNPNLPQQQKKSRRKSLGLFGKKKDNHFK